MIRALAIVATLTALLAVVPAASAETVTAGSGDVQAELSYTQDPATYMLTLGNLRVTRAATVAYDAPVDVCGGTCFLSGAPSDASALQVLDLDGDVEPEVVAPAYSGGAHCCTIATILSFQPASGTYLRTTREFGDAGYSIEDLDNDTRPEFVSADFRFAYRFSSYAESGMPVVVLSFDHGTFRNVSKRFKARLRADVKLWKREINRGIRQGKRKRNRDLRGYYAAWTADQYRLGNGRDARVALNNAAKRGWLNLESYGGVRPYGKQGRAYVRDLLAFLKRTGYR